MNNWQTFLKEGTQSYGSKDVIIYDRQVAIKCNLAIFIGKRGGLGMDHYRIEDLINQLSNLSYTQYQIHEIVTDTIGTTMLEDISQEGEQELIESLESYIQFALKCRNAKL